MPECMSGRCWEVQESEVHGSSVRGRLKSCLAFWKDELGAPPWMLDTIENGYLLPLYNELHPIPVLTRNLHWWKRILLMGLWQNCWEGGTLR